MAPFVVLDAPPIKNLPDERKLIPPAENAVPVGEPVGPSPSKSSVAVVWAKVPFDPKRKQITVSKRRFLRSRKEKIYFIICY